MADEFAIAADRTDAEVGPGLWLVTAAGRWPRRWPACRGPGPGRAVPALRGRRRRSAPGGPGGQRLHAVSGRGGRPGRPTGTTATGTGCSGRPTAAAGRRRGGVGRQRRERRPVAEGPGGQQQVLHRREQRRAEGARAGCGWRRRPRPRAPGAPPKPAAMDASTSSTIAAEVWATAWSRPPPSQSRRAMAASAARPSAERTTTNCHGCEFSALGARMAAASMRVTSASATGSSVNQRWARCPSTTAKRSAAGSTALNGGTAGEAAVGVPATFVRRDDRVIGDSSGLDRRRSRSGVGAGRARESPS